MVLCPSKDVFLFSMKMRDQSVKNVQQFWCNVDFKLYFSYLLNIKFSKILEKLSLIHEQKPKQLHNTEKY